MTLSLTFICGVGVILCRIISGLGVLPLKLTRRFLSSQAGESKLNAVLEGNTPVFAHLRAVSIAAGLFVQESNLELPIGCGNELTVNR